MARSHTNVDLRRDVFHMVPLSCICNAAGVQPPKARLLSLYFSHNPIRNKTKKKKKYLFEIAVSLAESFFNLLMLGEK